MYMGFEWDSNSCFN
jgi:hypothetical protein